MGSKGDQPSLLLLLFMGLQSGPWLRAVQLARRLTAERARLSLEIFVCFGDQFPIKGSAEWSLYLTGHVAAKRGFQVMNPRDAWLQRRKR